MQKRTISMVYASALNDDANRAPVVSVDRAKDAAVLRELGLARREALLSAWSHKTEGTPETHERAKDKRQWALDRLYARGIITIEQLAAAEEIVLVVEAVQRSVAPRCASLEARVDRSRGGQPALRESLSRIRMEVTYRLWRRALPVPRRLVIDLICSANSIRATSNAHGVTRPTAYKRLLRSLDTWVDLRARVSKLIDERDVEGCYARLGEGALL